MNSRPGRSAGKHPRILQLNIPRQFFAEIAAKQKTVEYRERKPHWRSRLEGRTYDLVCFRNGYSAEAPEMLIECRGIRRVEKDSKPYYAIRLGKIMEMKRWHAGV